MTGRLGWLALGVVLLSPAASARAQPICVGVGDCDHGGTVTVDELVKGVAIALSAADIDQCQAFACGGNQDVTVDCLVEGVQGALDGVSVGVNGSERVDVGGHKLNINCVGTGSPAVVFEAGGGNSLGTWFAVQPAVSGFTRACAYDRAGLGQSDLGPLPRDAKQIVSELHTLLQNSCVSQPIVLVGHSFGGQIIHLYASTYPQDVEGAVFVDPRSEYFYGRVSALFPDAYAAWVEANPCPSLSTGDGQECAAIDASDVQLQAAPPLPDVPASVFVAGHAPAPDGPPFTSDQLQQIDELWLGTNADLAESLPHGSLQVIPECGHFIHLCRPDLIYAAIRGIVDSSRTESRRIARKRSWSR